MTRTPEEIAANFIPDFNSEDQAELAAAIKEAVEAERERRAKLDRVLDIYLREYDTPAPDYGLRANLRKQLDDLLDDLRARSDPAREGG